MTTTEVGGLRCVTVRRGEVEIDVAVDAGPRLMGLRRADGPDLFAVLPGATLAWPGGGTFRFHGGHRLWRAPEDPAVTYAPDDDPVSIEETTDGVVVTGPPGPDQLVASVAITVGDEITVDHELRNDGTEPARMAAWAITQLRPGGVARLPLRSPGDHDVQADRSVVLWPYTRFDDEGWHLTDDEVVVRPTDHPLKVGVGGPGALSYELDGWTFTKRIAPDTGELADHGARRQCYADDRFVELETLGPIVTVAPGDAVTHREVWTLGRAS